MFLGSGDEMGTPWICTRCGRLLGKAEAGILWVKGRATYFIPLTESDALRAICRCGTHNKVPASLKSPGTRQFSPRDGARQER